MKRKISILVFFILLLRASFSQVIEKEKCFIFQLDFGTEIFAIDDGRLLESGYNTVDGCFIKIDYYNIGLIVKYCNLSKYNYFFEGEIQKQQRIGVTGETGSVIKPCLTIKIALNERFFMSEQLSIEENALIKNYESDEF